MPPSSRRFWTGSSPTFAGGWGSDLVRPERQVPPTRVQVDDLRDRFWHDVFVARGATNLAIARDAALFTLLAFGIYGFDKLVIPEVPIGVDVAPYEVAGGVLALLLILRTN